MKLKMWVITLIVAALIAMFLAGITTSTTGHIIKTATNGTFIEHFGETLESFGNDLLHSVKVTLSAICIVGVVGAVMYVKWKNS